MKDPAFLFYDGDAARDVSHMNRLERGCYFDLIQAQRKFHGFTVEQIRKILGKDFEECWPAIELVLTKNENGTLFIEWVNNSINKRKEHAEKQRERIQNYWDKKKKENDLEIPRNNYGKSADLPLVNEIEIENEIENIDKGGMGGKENPKPEPREMIPYQEIVESFNSKCKSLSKVQALSDSRRAKIKARWTELGSLDKFHELFNKTQNTPFLHGDNKENWKATFDWLIENDKNWLKVIEGNYDKNQSNGTHKQTTNIDFDGNKEGTFL